MATIAADPTYTRTQPEEHTGIWSWIATTDHKRIGILYLFTSLFFFFWGGLEAGLIRAQLAHANSTLLTAEQYNQLFTMHGTTMVFLAIMPLSAVFFNYLIPLQIGARDVAFPRLNAFSYWVYLFGGIFITLPILFGAAPDGGWFGYAPLTTRAYSPGINIDFWVLGLQILGISTLAAAFNFITTIINMRAPGMHLMRMPIFTWNAFVTQFLILLAFPVITIALVFLQFDRFFGTNFYTTSAGGDPLLWQHLFWIFGHPEVYILILPAFGLVSEIIPVYARKPLFGYPVMVYATILIGFLGFGVWAHHMFAVGMGPIGDSFFGLTTMLIAIPTGVKIFNWMATMWGGAIRFTTAMCYCIALVALFTIGGISGVMHSSPPADLQQTDTYFIVAHFHYVLYGGSIMGIFAGIYHYFPKMFGRFLHEGMGKVHFWGNFIGMNLTFFPMHFSGLLGMPRRTYQYDGNQGLEIFNQLSTAGVVLLILANLVFVFNFFRSLRGPMTAPTDPWGAPTIEWAIPSPPPEYNFAKLPTITSRYPLWDLKSPGLTADVPHTRQGEKGLEVDVGGKDVGHAHPNPTGGVTHNLPESAGYHLIERERYTARELGIPMPSSTAKPAAVALGIVMMAVGMLFKDHKEAVFFTLLFGGATVTIGFLYAWLTTPLEDVVHGHH